MKTEQTEALKYADKELSDIKIVYSGATKDSKIFKHKDLVCAFEQGQSNPKIKQLEWVFFDLYYEAETSVGCYTIFRIGVGKSNHVKCELMYNNRELSSHDSIESAMARAQIDFEKRIKECLE